MGLFTRIEDKMEDTLEGTASKMTNSPLSPVQIAKKAEKMMRREKMVGAGKQYAPTLYTVLVNREDDERLFDYYPTLAGETETYLMAKAAEQGLVMDGHPLVRFIVDDSLRHGKFDIIAQMVASHTIEDLRDEEMERYGLLDRREPSPNRSARRPQERRAPQNDYPQNDYYDDDFRPEPAAAAAPAPAAAAAKRAQAHNPSKHDTSKGVPVNTSTTLIDVETNRPYRITMTRMIIGRDNSCDIVVNDLSASRTHAELRLDAQGVWNLSDLGSTNGTYVNDQRISVSTPLYDGDRITIGETPLMFAQD